MSMPSDVNPDVAEAVRRMPDPIRSASQPDALDRLQARIKPEYLGWGIMSLVAFIGVAHLGPTIHRLTRKETTIEKTRRLAAEAKHHAKKQAKRATKRAKWAKHEANAHVRQARDLGGRAFRR